MRHIPAYRNVPLMTTGGIGHSFHAAQDSGMMWKIKI